MPDRACPQLDWGSDMIVVQNFYGVSVTEFKTKIEQFKTFMSGLNYDVLKSSPFRLFTGKMQKLNPNKENSGQRMG